MQWHVHLGCIAILVLYTAGCLTRLTSILAAVITISYAHRAPLANFGLDQVNSFLVVYLALAPCGKTWSIDRLWERWRIARLAVRCGRAPVYVAAAPVASARVVTRLLQIQVCVVYLFAGLGKLKGEAWWDGNAIWMAIANQEYQSADLTWLCHFPWLINLLTHFTVAWELTFVALVWRPRLRPVVLAAGILMHLGIGAFLGMWTFGLAMILSYLSFAPPEACAAIESAVAKRFLSGARVVTCGPGWIGRQWGAIRCALSFNTDLELRIEGPRSAPERTPPQPAWTPLAWCEAVLQKPSNEWPLASNPAAGGERRLLVICGNGTQRLNIQRHFDDRGWVCRGAPDLPQALTLLSLSAADVVLAVTATRDETTLFESFETLCRTFESRSPGTVLLTTPRLSEALTTRPTMRRRVALAPCSLGELRIEVESASPGGTPFSAVAAPANLPAPRKSKPSAAGAGSVAPRPARKPASQTLAVAGTGNGRPATSGVRTAAVPVKESR